ncbi:MAG: DNA recombination/repair protein RecA, partial [Nitrososphaera sp.]|nr:DNA recombination/repair protein RecA [Nitrososphaera sp.]
SYIPFPFPTGLAELDYHLGGKCGLPAGKIVEYYGLPSSGKTTLSYHTIAECHKMGGLALFVDTEQSWDDVRASEIGVNLDAISIAPARSIEAVFNVLEAFFTNAKEAGFKGPMLAVVDSVTGVPTQADLDGQITTEARIGHEAKQIRRGVRRLQGILSDTKALVIFINHAISKMASVPFAKQTQAAGGHGIKYMEFIRIELKGKGQIKKGSGDDQIRVGQEVGFEIEKLKNAHLPYPKIDSVELLDEGFNRVESLFAAAVKTKYIDKTKTGDVCTMFKGTDVERQFKVDEWPQVMAELGGYDAVYKAWVDHGKLAGVLNPWGS